MTIEEKANAYDEAIGIANDAYKDEDRHLKATLERIFPQLKESGDEKIRKKLLSSFKGIMADADEDELWNGLSYSDIIAWLEKQDKQKSTYLLDNSASNVKFPFKAKVKLNGKIVTIHGGQLSIDCKKYVKYQSNKKDGYMVYKPEDLELVCNIGQNPADKVEPKFKVGDIISNGISEVKIVSIDKNYYIVTNDEIENDANICNWVVYLKDQDNWKLVEQNLDDKVEQKFKIGQTIKKEGFNLGFTIVKIEDGFYYNDMGDHFPFTDQDNWELVEQKHAWSEDDEKRLQSCLKILQAKGLIGVTETINTKCLKSLKERVQPVQEWSEEDEKIHDFAIRAIGLCKQYAINHQVNGYSKLPDVPNRYEELQTWLKSLKDRVQPKQEWSEEDEKMFNKCVKTMKGAYYLDGEALYWLENRFKSLRPQPKQEWSKEDKKMIINICKNLYDYPRVNYPFDNDSFKEAQKQVDWFKDRVQSKQGWSKDDITRINEIIETLNIVQENRVRTQRMRYSKATIDKDIDWLKSLKDRVQSKQEWSEEDEEQLDRAIYMMEQLDMTNSWDDVYNWLKSLRPKKKQQEDEQPEYTEWSEEDEKMLNGIIKDLVHPWNEYIPDRIEEEIVWLKNKLKSIRPQSKWKPSDEQVNTLEHYMHTLVCNEHKEILFGLYAHLKKLKG